VSGNNTGAIEMTSRHFLTDIFNTATDIMLRRPWAPRAETDLGAAVDEAIEDVIATQLRWMRALAQTHRGAILKAAQTYCRTREPVEVPWDR